MKGEVEEDGIGSIIVVAGEEDLFHLREGNPQIDPFAVLPFRDLETDPIFLDR
jgi:hypothetical protein